MTTDEFIKKSQEKHKNEDGSPKYDYSKVEYVDQKTYVTIICPKHGEFKQAPNIHLYGKGCPFCERENSSSYKKITQEEFIEQAQKIHKNEDDSPKFDYSKVNYVNKTTKVCIICPKHGEFWQTPYNHLHSQGGCIGCAKELKISKRSSNTEEFIKKAKEIHKDENGNPKYDYSKVVYKNAFTKVCIICPKHGEFWQTPANHLSGYNCLKCSYENIGNHNKSSAEEFIKKASELHVDKNGNPKYDYSKVEYKNAHTKVCIICKEHGEFWQTPDKHLQGQGCSKCNISFLEQSIIKLLLKNNISYYYRYKPALLERMEYDFYIPNFNIAIECQGIQHFTPLKIFGGEEGFKSQIKRDELKNKLSEENGIKLLYFANSKYGRDDIITSEDELIETIKKRL